MKRIVMSILLMSSTLALSDGYVMQFVRSVCGKNVTVMIDGKVEVTFAGKMGFRGPNSSWLSVCGDIRTPVCEGQFCEFAPRDTSAVGGNMAKAGNIVAKYFNAAKTREQCAGLQIAVWEALEYGDAALANPNGCFQVQADQATLAYAEKYYSAADDSGHATCLGSPNRAFQTQVTPDNPPTSAVS